MPKHKMRKSSGNRGHSMYNGQDYSSRKLGKSETTGSGSFEKSGSVKPSGNNVTPGSSKPMPGSGGN